ncbi:GNAT family N-acetyltransferase [Shewanella sp. KT0246]|uniref:GNAT family N-acetyltransferase n=1 Tax=Shewanella sp. KT0246 TaxID=2815912 RepID=UPI001BB96533|nr:GNAT family N-acetyltransferase [Shewanella sp. KT0246]GIU51327.1 N-acetyltransferase [Shewanella sp. KT0246]
MINTERLTLREFTLDDGEFIYQLMNSPLYIEFIGDRGIKTLEDAQAFLSTNLIRSYEINGYGLFAVIRNQDECVIGMSGLVNREGLPYTDIGFGFLPQYMGKGYAYESAKAVMDYASGTLGIAPILGITSLENTASISLLNKLGLVHQQRILWGEEQELILMLSTEEISSSLTLAMS